MNSSSFDTFYVIGKNEMIAIDHLPLILLHLKVWFLHSSDWMNCMSVDVLLNFSVIICIFIDSKKCSQIFQWQRQRQRQQALNTEHWKTNEFFWNAHKPTVILIIFR